MPCLEICLNFKSGNLGYLCKLTENALHSLRNGRVKQTHFIIQPWGYSGGFVYLIRGIKGNITLNLGIKMEALILRHHYF